jgi:dihydroorotate dehydrogenase electron transfer subunit
MGSIAQRLGAKASLFYGERAKAMAIDCSHLPPEASVAFITEDGSGPGPKGLATEPLAEALKTDPRPVFACGPNPMLKAAYELGKAFSVPVLVCLEARMACGLGACLSCAIPKKGGGYLRACLEGPVIDASLIDWEAFS